MVECCLRLCFNLQKYRFTWGGLQLSFFYTEFGRQNLKMMRNFRQNPQMSRNFPQKNQINTEFPAKPPNDAEFGAKFRTMELRNFFVATMGRAIWEGL